MAASVKVLGQLAPTPSTLSTLYTVPAATSTVVSSLTICNRGSSAVKFRVAIRPNGATLANQHYLYYDQTVGGFDTFVATIGLTMDAADVVSVYTTLPSSTPILTYQLFGEEIA